MTLGGGRIARAQYASARGLTSSAVIAAESSAWWGPSRPTQVRSASRAMVLLGSAAGVVLLWTLSYLVRQPTAGVLDAPAAHARYALEGMALALVWLGAVAGGCVAVLTGVVTLREPGRD